MPTPTEQAKTEMQGIARYCKAHLPPGWCYIVLATPLGEESGQMLYVSNGQRNDVVKAMAEFIGTVKAKAWGTDQI